MRANPRPRLHARDHLPGGADPIDFSGVNIGSALPAFGDALFDLGCDHLWQFNEDTGTTAADAFGSDDLTAFTGGSGPGSITWGSVASPPGTASVELDNGNGINSLSNKVAQFGGSMGALTNTFSAGCWIYTGHRDEALVIMGQGTPIESDGGVYGWTIGINNSNFKPVLYTEDGGGFTTLTGTDPIANSTWYLIGISVDPSNVATIYMNGQPVVTGGVDIGAHTGIYFGNDGTFGYTGSLSFGFTFNTHNLSDDEWAQLYATGYPFASDAQVLSADGVGGTKWRTIAGTGGITITETGTEIQVGGGGSLTVYVDGS